MLADWKGILLSALGSALVVFALIEGQTYGWWHPRATLELGPLHWSASAPLSPVPVSLILGLALLAAFALTELVRARRGRMVILDVSMFAIGTFGWGNLTAAIVNAGQFAVMFILPLYLINARGLSPLGAGSILGVMALGSVVSGGLARVVSARLGAGGTVQTGLLMEIVGVALSILLMHGSVPVWPMTLTLIIYGAGLGFASAQLTSLVLSGVPVAQSGQASATQSTIRQWGTALGAAVSGSALSLALSLVLPRHLTALKGISAQMADGLVRSVQSSAGNAIVGLRAQGTRGRLGALGPQVTNALTEGFTQGAQWAMGFAVLLLFLGLVASVLVRRAARKAGADKV